MAIRRRVERMKRLARPELTPTEEHGYRILETVSALTAEVYLSHMNLDRFMRVTPNMSHVERLRVVIDASYGLEHHAKGENIVWDETHDWIMCIEKLASEVASGTVNWGIVFFTGRIVEKVGGY